MTVLRSERRDVRSSEDVVGAIDNIVRTYLDTRTADERFLDTVRRVGISPFKERLYAAA